MSVVSTAVKIVTRGMDAILAATRSATHVVLHPARHARVRDAIGRRPRPRRIVVACHANVCRSPYLAALLARALPDVEVASAGFAGPTRRVPEHGVTVAARRGIDLSTHRSRVLTPSLLAGADLVVVMDAHQARALERGFGYPPDRIIVAGDLDPVAGSSRAIQDPWRQPKRVFEASYLRLDRCATVLTGALRRPKSVARGRVRH